MDLRDRNPAWIVNADVRGFDLSSSCIGAQGIMFDAEDGSARIYWFDNPIFAQPIPHEVEPFNRWFRVGHSFAALELTQTIHAQG